MPNTEIPNTDIVVPDSVRLLAEQSLGAFFESISRTTPKDAATDHLDLKKSFKRAQLIERYTPLRGKKVLEIGSGFGTNLAVWIRSYQVDGYGTEPDGVGFGASYSGSRELFAFNGLGPERIVGVKGEALPFPDAAFDIVYSGNVLEHTEDPVKVIEEAVRVLRPGGILHFEMPNYLSYFEGHYMLPQPPLLWRSLLPFWSVSGAAILPLPAPCEPRSIPCGAAAQSSRPTRSTPSPCYRWATTSSSAASRSPSSLKCRKRPESFNPSSRSPSAST